MGRSLVRGVALAALGSAATVGTRWLLAPPPAPRIVDYRPLTGGQKGRISSFATDGERVYFTLGDGAETRQMSLGGGASAPLEVPFGAGYVLDASKSRSSVLMLGWDAPVLLNRRTWSTVVRSRAGGGRPQAGTRGQLGRVVA